MTVSISEVPWTNRSRENAFCNLPKLQNRRAHTLGPRNPALKTEAYRGLPIAELLSTCLKGGEQPDATTRQRAQRGEEPGSLGSGRQSTLFTKQSRLQNSVSLSTAGVRGGASMGLAGWARYRRDQRCWLPGDRHREAVGSGGSEIS